MTAYSDLPTTKSPQPGELLNYAPEPVVDPDKQFYTSVGLVFKTSPGKSLVFKTSPAKKTASKK